MYIYCYKNLIKACKRRLEKGDKEIIRKAFEVSVEAHKEMRRKSGEPYIYHPIAVATICVSIHIESAPSLNFRRNF